MSIVDIDLGEIVNGNANYTDFRFEPHFYPLFTALFPLVYILPTCVVIFRICHVYVQKGVRKRDETVNRHVFIVIILAQTTCLCFFLSDYLTLRVPSTGVMTPWCREQEPNKLLLLLFYSQIYFNYPVMIYPVLLTVVRLVPVYFPSIHPKINSKILSYSIPMIYLYPFAFTFFMLPARGVCRQHQSPFQFGAVYLHFIGSWNGMINAPFQFSNCLFWLSVCLVANFFLYRKLRSLARCSLVGNRSARFQKAEFSLNVTNSAMLLAYLTNIVFLLSFLIDIRVASYAVVFRPFGNDLKTCVVPWVFYMTHPAFQPRPKKMRGSEASYRQKTAINV